MKRTTALTGTIALITIATAAIAHDAVKNPQVKARMAAMEMISKNMKIVGAMAQGKTAFNADVAQQAVNAITQQANLVPELFKPQESDPKSEALPAIWTNWADFDAEARAMHSAAQGVDTGSVESLGQGLRALGGSCKSCHADYRM